MMGEIRDLDEQETHDDALAATRAAAGLWAARGDEEMARRLRAAAEYPEPVVDKPLILDTDIGGDPDDAVAVAMAALNVPRLALVVTSDELGGERARFARHLLDLCGRPEVPVIAGLDLGNDRYWVVPALIPDSVPKQPDNLERAAELCRASGGTVRWVTIGPLSNLAAIVSDHPDLVERLRVTSMAGAINYRKPGGVEHNIRLDVSAARTVLGTIHDPELVLSDVTFNPAVAIDAASDLYRRLATTEAPAWARLLVAHLDAWFERFYPESRMHDPLTLSVALGNSYVDTDYSTIAMDDTGRLFLTDTGNRVLMSSRAEYDLFTRWLTAQFTPHLPQR